jgi:hypothetical protein
MYFYTLKHTYTPRKNHSIAPLPASMDGLLHSSERKAITKKKGKGNAITETYFGPTKKAIY